jgi:hypothetical protein
MKWLYAISSLVVCIFLTASACAEGLLYQLPDDGGWAKFELNARTVDPDGTEKTTMSGTLTISSVGAIEVEGQRCRWIELVFHGTRIDEKVYTDVNKLLIPEKHLAQGEDPIKHVLKAWRMHSKNPGNAPIEIPDVQNPESPGGQSVRRDELRLFLHEPFLAPQNLGKATVEGEFGKLECMGISAQEHSKNREVLRHSKFLIRLNNDVPFGVVTWRAEMKFEQDEKLLTTLTTIVKLLDFGKDAKSSIPESK